MPQQQLGPAEVTFKGTSLGLFESVILRDKLTTVNGKTSTFGTSPEDVYTTGREVEVEINMTKPTIALLESITSGATLTGSQLMLASSVGNSLRDNESGLLVIKPLVNNVADIDPANWYTFFVAAPIPDWELTFDGESERVYKTIFMALVATSADSGDSGQLYGVGDVYAIGWGVVS